jgi:hypothetical protein
MPEENSSPCVQSNLAVGSRWRVYLVFQRQIADAVTAGSTKG